MSTEDIKTKADSSEAKIIFSYFLVKPFKDVIIKIVKLKYYLLTILQIMTNPAKLYDNNPNHKKILSASELTQSTFKLNLVLIVISIFFKEIKAESFDINSVAEFLFIFFYIACILVIIATSYLLDLLENKKIDNHELFFKSMIYIFNFMFIIFFANNILNSQESRRMGTILCFSFLFHIYFFYRVRGKFKNRKTIIITFFTSFIIQTVLFVFIDLATNPEAIAVGIKN